MAGKSGKKGFAGLSDLVSVSDVGNESLPEESQPSESTQLGDAQSKNKESEQEQKASSNPEPVAKGWASSRNESEGSGGKWLLGLILFLFVIGIISKNNNQNSNHAPSTQNNSPLVETPAPAVKASTTASAVRSASVTEDTALQYVEPPIGTNAVLSSAQIRWCLREEIGIDAMRTVLTTNKGIDQFNDIVNYYNQRCASFQYRQGALSRAKQDVEPHRSQIVSEAIRTAKQWEQKYSTVSTPTTKAPVKPSALHTREAQRLLKDLGYDPGPIDGDYGRRTADAVRAFQKANGQVVDGWVSESLLKKLRNAAGTMSKKKIDTATTIGDKPLITEQSSTSMFDGISDDDRAGIVDACKYRGSPSNVYSCQQEELRKLKHSGSAPDLSRLSSADRSGIIDACRYRGSPANVYNCQRDELRKLKQSGSAPDLSRLSSADRSGIIDACRYRGSPANVYNCQRDELRKLQQSGPAPDLSRLSSADRSGIVDACRYRGSPANVYNCQRDELRKLQQSGPAPDLSQLSSADRSGIIDACRYRGSPANVYNCQRDELRKLQRSGPAPDLSHLSSVDRAEIISTCKYRGSPANVYNCQKEQLIKLGTFR